MWNFIYADPKKLNFAQSYCSMLNPSNTSSDGRSLYRTDVLLYCNFAFLHFSLLLAQCSKCTNLFIQSWRGLCIIRPYCNLILRPYSAIFTVAFSSISMWMDPLYFSFITRVWLDQGPTNIYRVPWPIPLPAPFFPSKKLLAPLINNTTSVVYCYNFFWMFLCISWAWDTALLTRECFSHNLRIFNR